MDLFSNLKNWNLNNSQGRTRIFVVGLLFFLFLLLIFLLTGPKIEEKDPTTKPEVTQAPKEKDVVIQSDDGDLILYEDDDGAKELESLDYEKTEEEAREELGISDKEEVDYQVPAAAGPRAVTQEDIDKEYEERWGIPPEWGD